MSTVGAFLTYEFQSIRFLENPCRILWSYATIHQISYENSSLSHHPIGTWQTSAPMPQQNPTSGARLEPHQHRPGGTARWIAGRSVPGWPKWKTPGTCDQYCDTCAAYWILKQAGTLLNQLTCLFLWRWKPKTAVQILQNTRTLGTLGHCLSIVYVFGGM